MHLMLSRSIRVSISTSILKIGFHVCLSTLVTFVGQTPFSLAQFFSSKIQFKKKLKKEKERIPTKYKYNFLFLFLKKVTIWVILLSRTTLSLSLSYLYNYKDSSLSKLLLNSQSKPHLSQLLFHISLSIILTQPM